MSKSVPRSSRPSSRKPTPKRPVAKRPVHRRTRRPARRSIARVHDLGGEAGAVVQHVIPARTVARERALALFAELGVKASKPTLRRATDRIEKVIKANRKLPFLGAPSLAPSGVQGIIDHEPSSLGALREVARDEIVKAGRAGEAVEMRALLDDGRGRDYREFAGPPQGAVGRAIENHNGAQTPWSQVYGALDEATSMLAQRVEQLTGKLGPVLLPPNTPPPSVGTAAGAPTGTPHVLEGVEMQRNRIDYIRGRVVELLDRVVV